MKNFIKKFKVTVVEFCSGIGATLIALQIASRRLDGVCFSSNGIAEIDKQAIEAHELLNGKVYNYGDVTAADFSDLDCFVLFFTFPCTDMSKANNKAKGFEEDTDGASSIVWALRNVLKAMRRKPRIIFMENVPQMVTTYNDTFQKLKTFLEENGYHVYYKILDAADFNVPQHRERVYIIASLKEVDFEFPQPVKLRKKLRNILDKEVAEKYYIQDTKTFQGFLRKSMDNKYVVRVHNPKHCDKAYTVTTRSGGRSSDNFIFESDISKDNVVRLTPAFLESHNLDIEDVNKVRIRKLTRYENMKLMGLNKWQRDKLAKFSDTAIAKLMGNSICIPVLVAIFENFFRAYFENLDKEDIAFLEGGDF